MRLKILNLSLGRPPTLSAPNLSFLAVLSCPFRLRMDHGYSSFTPCRLQKYDPSGVLQLVNLNKFQLKTKNLGSARLIS